MKSKIWSVALLLVVALTVTVTYAPAQDKGSLITVLNPEVANRMPDRLPLSPRLDSLEGKTLFLVDIGWGGPDAAPSVYAEIKAWLAENMPGVRTEYRRIRGGYDAGDPELWKEIKAKGNAAFVGISG